jgi:thioredoxin-related protein
MTAAGKIPMITRRQAILGGSALALAGSKANAQAILTEDGIYKQPWFLESFLELADDLEAATKQGKRFAVLWELRGCPYCRDLHHVNFAREDIADYVMANFVILQLNFIGSRKVTDFDGQELGEKQLAARYGIRGTPTIQFFAESAAGLKELPPANREVARIPGYLKPDDFLGMFRYVRENGYETKGMPDLSKAPRS